MFAGYVFKANENKQIAKSGIFRNRGYTIYVREIPVQSK
jgi:hypothetical protein